ncbi:MAG: hypothetical protein JXA42_23665, partial [Anaerolineales bacterium]|nr:hypothetical protein [Anaerolineales bacterium]
PEEPTGPLPVLAAAETACGRVAAAADNGFQDDGFEGRRGDILMRALLEWAVNGNVCEVSTIYLPLVLRE